jgi:hypothetical protein
MRTIEVLARDAADSVADMLDDDAWDRFEALSPIEQVKYRYLHADCDDVALVLHHALGWPFIAVSSENGMLHRLVQSPDGRLLDVGGWTDAAALAARYKTKKLAVSEAGGEEMCQSTLHDDPEDFQQVVAALLQIETEPFCGALRAQLEQYGVTVGLHFGTTAATSGDITSFNP